MERLPDELEVQDIFLALILATSHLSQHELHLDVFRPQQRKLKQVSKKDLVVQSKDIFKKYKKADGHSYRKTDRLLWAKRVRFLVTLPNVS